MFRSCSQIPPRVRLYLSSKCPEVFYVLCFKRTGINLALPSTECNLTWRRCGIQGDTFLTSWFLWFFTYEWSSAGIHIPEYQLLLFLFCMNLKATTQTHHPYFILFILVLYSHFFLRLSKTDHFPHWNGTSVGVRVWALVVAVDCAIHVVKWTTTTFQTIRDL